MNNLLKILGSLTVVLVAAWLTACALAAEGACYVSPGVFHVIAFCATVSVPTLLTALIIRAIWDTSQ